MVVRFGATDYVVCIIMLLISASIGFYYRFTGGRQSTKLEYLLAGRNMSFVPVAFSLLASFMSAITLMGVTTENYMYGTQFVVINLAYGIATPVAAYLFLPTFFNLQEYTVYQYLEYRFGSSTRVVCSVTFTLMMVLYAGIVLYAPAQALSAVSGLDIVFSLITIGLVCTLYSSLGGMKAVLITDVFQTVLMFAAVFLVVIVGSRSVGGLSEVFRIAQEGGRLQLFDLSLDPRRHATLWTQLVGGFFLYLSLYAVSQAQVQRLLSVGSLRRSQMALWLQWPILTSLSLTTSLAGLVIYANYRGCDPLLAGRITKRDQLLPYFVMDKVGHITGLPGLFLAGIFSGSLSTVSSAVNSIAAICIQDFIRPLSCWQRVSTVRMELVVTKLCSYTFGVLFVLLAYALSMFESKLLQMSLAVFGAVGGPLLAVFSMGMFTTSANQKGVLCGLFCGLLTTFVLQLAPLFFPNLSQSSGALPVSDAFCLNTTSATLSTISGNYSASSLSPNPYANVEYTWYQSIFSVSFMWMSLLGFSVCYTVGMVMSVCCRCCENSPEGVRVVYLDSSLLSPPLARLYFRLGWLPRCSNSGFDNLGQAAFSPTHDGVELQTKL